MPRLINTQCGRTLGAARLAVTHAASPIVPARPFLRPVSTSPASHHAANMPFRLSIASLLLALALVPATTAQTPNPAFMQLMFDKPKMTAEQAANVEGAWPSAPPAPRPARPTPLPPPPCRGRCPGRRGPSPRQPLMHPPVVHRRVGPGGRLPPGRHRGGRRAAQGRRRLGRQAARLRGCARRVLEGSCSLAGRGSCGARPAAACAGSRTPRTHSARPPPSRQRGCEKRRRRVTRLAAAPAPATLAAARPLPALPGRHHAERAGLRAGQQPDLPHLGDQLQRHLGPVLGLLPPL